MKCRGFVRTRAGGMTALGGFCRRSLRTGDPGSGNATGVRALGCAYAGWRAWMGSPESRRSGTLTIAKIQPEGSSIREHRDMEAAGIELTERN
jgi:hypothetical protein